MSEERLSVGIVFVENDGSVGGVLSSKKLSVVSEILSGDEFERFSKTAFDYIDLRSIEELSEYINKTCNYVYVSDVQTIDMEDRKWVYENFVKNTK